MLALFNKTISHLINETQLTWDAGFDVYNDWHLLMDLFLYYKNYQVTLHITIGEYYFQVCDFCLHRICLTLWSYVTVPV